MATSWAQSRKGPVLPAMAPAEEGNRPGSREARNGFQEERAGQQMPLYGTGRRPEWSSNFFCNTEASKGVPFESWLGCDERASYSGKRLWLLVRMLRRRRLLPFWRLFISIKRYRTAQKSMTPEHGRKAGGGGALPSSPAPWEPGTLQSQHHQGTERLWKRQENNPQSRLAVLQAPTHNPMKRKETPRKKGHVEDKEEAQSRTKGDVVGYKELQRKAR